MITKIGIDPYEKKVIDSYIDNYRSAGIIISGEDPVIMGSLFRNIGKFFKKAGRGVVNLAKKIKQRIKDKGLKADVSTDEGSFSVGPDSTKIDTPQVSYESTPKGMRFRTDQFEAKTGPGPIDTQVPITVPDQPTTNYLPYIIAGAVILILMAKK